MRHVMRPRGTVVQMADGEATPLGWSDVVVIDKADWQELAKIVGSYHLIRGLKEDDLRRALTIIDRIGYQ